MKNKTFPYVFFHLALIFSLLVQCEKKVEKFAPTVNLSLIKDITSNSATSVGEVISDGGAKITEKGVCWDKNQNPTTSGNKSSDGSGPGSYVSLITGLSPSSTYYVKAFATNEVGTSYSSQDTIKTIAFIPVNTIPTVPVNTTVPTAPVVTAIDTVLDITTTDIWEKYFDTVSSGGKVTNDRGSKVTVCGVCWSTNPKPTIADSKTNDSFGPNGFLSRPAGLLHNTTYYLRAYATNSKGTGYGNEITFTTHCSNCPIVFNPDLTYGTVTDIDGNVYKTIKIGTQTWMAENLKTTRYQNGDPISYLTDTTLKASLLGVYCWHNNDPATYKAIYGALYNWNAVNDSRNIAPKGWHVPTKTEWTTLINYLGGEKEACSKMREEGITHYWFPIPGNNSSGFTAIPGPLYHYWGIFLKIYPNTLWWTSSEGYNNYIWTLLYNPLLLTWDLGNKADCSLVRCLQN